VVLYFLAAYIWCKKIFITLIDKASTMNMGLFLGKMCCEWEKQIGFIQFLLKEADSLHNL
jgi:hypothetical protein